MGVSFDHQADIARAELGRSRAVGPWLAMWVLMLATGAVACFALEWGLREPGPDEVLAADLRHLATAGDDCRGTEACARRESGATRLHIAGSGTNLPLVRLLARRYRELHPEGRVMVHGSIGSGGGLRALRDGVIDLAVVSRPVSADELGESWAAFAHAEVRVVVAGHRSAARHRPTWSRVLRMYAGELRQWPDGMPVTVYLREPGDSGRRAMAAARPEFASALERARGRWRVLDSDAAMQAALLSTPGSIGLFDCGAIVSEGLPLATMADDEAGGDCLGPRIEPETKPNRDSRDAAKVLSFVHARSPTPSVLAWLQFVRSSEARTLTRQAGYEALDGI